MRQIHPTASPAEAAPRTSQPRCTRPVRQRCAHPPPLTCCTVTHAIVIIEDHPDIRDHLRDALSADRAFVVHATCRSQQEGQEVVEQYCPDILLVDLGLPNGGNGLVNIRHAQRKWGRRCQCAVLTVARNEEYLMDAVRAGAVGYVGKTEPDPAWLAAVKAIAAGGSPLNAALARLMQDDVKAGAHAQADAALQEVRELLRYAAAGYTLDEIATRWQQPLAAVAHCARRAYHHVAGVAATRERQLSEREAMLLKLLAQGHSIKTCAEMLAVAESTAKTFTQRLYEKLGVNSRDGAIHQARRQGLLAPG